LIPFNPQFNNNNQHHKFYTLLAEKPLRLTKRKTTTPYSNPHNNPNYKLPKGTIPKDIIMLGKLCNNNLNDWHNLTSNWTPTRGQSLLLSLGFSFKPTPEPLPYHCYIHDVIDYYYRIINRLENEYPSNSLTPLQILIANFKKTKTKLYKPDHLPIPLNNPNPNNTTTSEPTNDKTIIHTYLRNIKNHIITQASTSTPSNKKRGRSILTRTITALTDSLLANKNIYVTLTDKNLGPVVVDTSWYETQVSLS